MVSDTTTKSNVLVLDISSAAQQQSVTASEQSSAVTEISATIEELSASSAQIADNAESVAGIAARTLDKTENGVVAVQTLLNQMGEINEGNQNSINGVVDLGKSPRKSQKLWQS
jgi:methyl-accepting chemotaxis protein